MNYGAFLPVANNGWIMSETSPRYMLNKEICERAEAGGYDKGGTTGTLLGSERPMTPPVELDDTPPALAQGGCFMAPQLVSSYDRIAHYMNELKTRPGIADLPTGLTAPAPAEAH